MNDDLTERLTYLCSPAAEAMPDGSRLTALVVAGQEAVKSLILARTELATATVWRPMETAPGDGQLILVAEQLGRVTIARWESSEIGAGWWRDQTAEDYAVGECNPTHWLPIPGESG